MTTRTNYGRLYDVDMRLRPSGRSGPVATSIAAFSDYQHNEAWTWEHMALTRARVASASSPALAARIVSVIRDVLCSPRDPDMVAGDVVEMRKAVAAEKGDGTRWDLKNAAGGLVDIEFIAQYLQLVHAEREPGILNPSTGRVLERAARLGILGVEDAEVLRPAERLYQDLGQILRLCLVGPVRSQIRRRQPHEPARARRRRAGLPRPRRPSRRDPGARAQALREHPRQCAVMFAAAQQV